MGKIKTDSVQFTTQRSLKELNALLRRAVNATKAQVEKLDDDPMDAADGESVAPSLAVLLSGSNFMGGSRLWGVQVFFYEFGDRRIVELVAVGESFGAGVMSYYTGGYFQLSDGKRRRERIMAILTEGDLTVREGAHTDDDLSPAPAAARAGQSAAASGGSVSGMSGASGGAPAPSGSGKRRPLAISPDGLDPMASPAYLAMCRLEDSTGDLSSEEKGNFAYSTFALLCGTFADQRKDFPCLSELKLIRGLLEAEGSRQRYIYQPYIDLFPDQDEAVRRAASALRDWLETHPEDAMARVAFAGFAETIEDHDAANEHLYKALLSESRGADLSECLLCWAGNARSGGFDQWYLRTYGPRSADDPLPAPPPVKEASRQAAQAVPGAPAAAGGRSAHLAAPAGPAGPAAHADGGLFQLLSESTRERKFALTMAAAAAAGYLLATFGQVTYVLPLLLAAAFLGLILFDKPMDSLYMTVLASVPAALILLSLLLGSSGQSLLFLLSLLLTVAVAALYWLLYLKKGLPQIQCVRLLGVAFLLRILLGVLSAFSSLITMFQLHYFRLLLVGVLPNIASVLLNLAILAALYGTTRDQMSGSR